MKKVLFALMLTMLLAGPAAAIMVAGTAIEPTVIVNERPLQLNGYGIRTKWWVKVYIGSLYTAKPMSVAADVMADPSDKLIRLNFLHSKVDRKKITEAIREGFTNTRMDESAVAKQFLALFRRDFMRGDTVDLVLGGDGVVVYKHNNQAMGTITSKQLVRGILGIYLGPMPADKDLKSGMLGKN
ncbi:MAG: chalcone isomerase family protein [Desulfuromonadaceae bacterium]|nr:chalcone isomerase family protein [Desulfuromonadaceae bacterium]